MPEHYETEYHMRAAKPYEANHLATIAQLINGVWQAQIAHRIYTWNA